MPIKKQLEKDALFYIGSLTEICVVFNELSLLPVRSGLLKYLTIHAMALPVKPIINLDMESFIFTFTLIAQVLSMANRVNN